MFGFAKETLAKAVKEGAGKAKKMAGNVAQSVSEIPAVQQATEFVQDPVNQAAAQAYAPQLAAGAVGAAGLGAVGGAMAGNALGQEQGQQQVMEEMQQQQQMQQQQAMQQAVLSAMNAKEGTMSWNALAKSLSQIDPALEQISYDEANMLAQQTSQQLGIPLQVVR
jgi:hypothetical protein